MDFKSDTKLQLHEQITKDLGELIESSSSTFACGGSVFINSGKINHGVLAAPLSSPVTLRWDTVDANKLGVSKLTLPIDTENEESSVGLENLVAACQPASFGYKGRDVIDESYRRATKMDRSAFSTDFCPYEVGIVDMIAQLLLPNAPGYLGTKGIKAELYKLNIYAGPSGLFKAHVDTPRSDHQFGSLVVCLPCRHEGGQLVIRHLGKSVTFDWGASSSREGADPCIQWAAFYSDCEHEVLEVTKVIVSR